MYSIYGANYCFNVVAANQGEPEAVLVRAVEPIENIKLIKERR
jgi:DNA-3-methyladenine glycosylase